MEIKNTVEDLISSYKKLNFNLLQICGDEFDIKEVLAYIKKNFLPENIEVFFPEDKEEIVKSLSIKNIFGPKLIIVYDIDSIGGSLIKEVKKALEKPERLKPNFVILIFKKEENIFKIENSLAGKFKSFYDSNIPTWIKNFVEERGFSITKEAINLLHFKCGSNREEIKRHIERVIFLKENQNKSITEEDLENLGFYRDDTIFKISNSILEGKYKEALRYLVEYSDEIPLFHFVNRDLRRLLTIRANIDEKRKEEEIDFQRLNIHPYIFHKEYLPSARKLSYDFLESQFEKIMEGEYKIKNGWEEFSINFNFICEFQNGG
ncbi:MAG: DNA polymerase III subunit delta [candidate division WOR-3 bacterium]